MLAPLLMMGGALGGVEAMVAARTKASASGRSSAWARSSAGRCDRRLPASIFALELTHDVNMLLPLLVAVTIAHGFTVLVLKRSILTEKVAAAGYHLTREYAIDPLEILFAREVMRTNVAALPAEAPIGQVRESLRVDPAIGPQQLFPVVDEERRLQGVVTRFTLQQLADQHASTPMVSLAVHPPRQPGGCLCRRAIAFRRSPHG